MQNARFIPVIPESKDVLETKDVLDKNTQKDELGNLVFYAQSTAQEDEKNNHFNSSHSAKHARIFGMNPLFKPATNRTMIKTKFDLLGFQWARSFFCFVFQVLFLLRI